MMNGAGAANGRYNHRNGDWTETDRITDDRLPNQLAVIFEQPEAVACEQEPLRVVEHL